MFYLFILLNLHLFNHGGHLATFKYEISEDQIALEFQIERSTLDHFDMRERCKSFETTTAFCLANHIKENLQFELNNQAIDFELQGAEQEQGIFTLRMAATGTFSSEKQLIIKNQCFYEFDRQLENRIIIQRGDESKSYRMNHKRQELKIQLTHL